MNSVSQRSGSAAPRRSVLATLAAAPLLAAAALPLAVPQGRPPTPVRVDAVRQEIVQEKRRVTGDLRAVHDTAVASQEPGIVTALLVREGYEVEKDDVLARLDRKRLELELMALDAQDKVAAATLNERRSDMELAERDLASLELLAERDAANPKELADARTEVAGAAARLEQAESEITVLAARRSLLQERLSDMEIRAPFAGVVVELYTEVGEWLTAGAPVARIVSTGELEAWIEVPQRDYAAVLAAPGELSVRVDATGERLSITRYRPIAVVDGSARTFRVVGEVPEGLALAPGMSLTAEVPTAASAPHLTVAHDAILRNEVGPYVYVAMPGGEGQPHQAMPVQVKILFRTRERAVVRSPRLMPGAMVVVEGNERLYPTAAVQPVGGAEGPPQEEGATPPGDAPAGGEASGDDSDDASGEQGAAQR